MNYLDHTFFAQFKWLILEAEILKEIDKNTTLLSENLDVFPIYDHSICLTVGLSSSLIPEP